MEDFKKTVQIARQNVQAAKEISLDPYSSAQNSESVQQVNKTAASSIGINFAPNSTESEATQSTAYKTEDGDWAVLDRNGVTHTGLTELEANEFAAWDTSDLQADIDAAPDGLVQDAYNRLVQGTANLGVSAGKGLTLFPSMADGIAQHNTQVFGPFNKNSQYAQKIVDEDLNTFNRINTVGVNTLADAAFKKSYAYKTLSDISKRVERGKDHIQDLNKYAAEVSHNSPVNRRNEAAASAAWDVLAKNKGNIGALWNAITEHTGSYLNQGVDSIPYMVALTVGGPVSQTGVMVTLASGRSVELTEEFVEINGREPTQDEKNRIDMWATAATVLEKAGDHLGILGVNKIAKGIAAKTLGKNKAKTIHNRAKSFMRVQQKYLPKSLQYLNKPITRLRLQADKIPGALVGLGGEAVSGASTEAAEQMGRDGKLNTSEIVKAGFAEAMGAPIGAPAAGVIGTTLKTAKNKLLGDDTPVEQIKSEEAKAVKEFVEKVEEIKKQKEDQNKTHTDINNPNKQDKINNIELFKELDELDTTNENSLLDTLNNKINEQKTISKENYTISLDDAEFETKISELTELTEKDPVKASKVILDTFKDSDVSQKQFDTLNDVINKISDKKAKLSDEKSKEIADNFKELFNEEDDLGSSEKENNLQKNYTNSFKNKYKQLKKAYVNLKKYNTGLDTEGKDTYHETYKLAKEISETLDDVSQSHKERRLVLAPILKALQKVRSNQADKLIAMNAAKALKRKPRTVRAVIATSLNNDPESTEIKYIAKLIPTEEITTLQNAGHRVYVMDHTSDKRFVGKGIYTTAKTELDFTDTLLDYIGIYKTPYKNSKETNDSNTSDTKPTEIDNTSINSSETNKESNTHSNPSKSIDKTNKNTSKNITKIKAKVGNFRKKITPSKVPASEYDINHLSSLIKQEEYTHVLDWLKNTAKYLHTLKDAHKEQQQVVIAQALGMLAYKDQQDVLQQWDNFIKDNNITEADLIPVPVSKNKLSTSDLENQKENLLNQIKLFDIQKSKDAKSISRFLMKLAKLHKSISKEVREPLMNALRERLVELEAIRYIMEYHAYAASLLTIPQQTAYIRRAVQDIHKHIGKEAKDFKKVKVSNLQRYLDVLDTYNVSLDSKYIKLRKDVTDLRKIIQDTLINEHPDDYKKLLDIRAAVKTDRILKRVSNRKIDKSMKVRKGSFSKLDHIDTVANAQIINKSGKATFNAQLGIAGCRIRELIHIQKADGIPTIPNNIFGEVSVAENNKVIYSKAPADIFADLAAYLVKYVPRAQADDIAISFVELWDKHLHIRNTTPYIDGVFAARQSLDLLMDSNGILPPQVVFAMTLAGHKWLMQHPSETPLNSSRAQQEFVHGSNNTALTVQESLELVGIGHSWRQAATSIGKEVSHYLHLQHNGKHAHKNENRLQDTNNKVDDSILSYYYPESNKINTSVQYDTYMDKLETAMGMYALELLNSTSSKDIYSYLNIETKIWNLGEPDNLLDSRRITDGSSYNHITRTKEQRKQLHTNAQQAVTALDTALNKGTKDTAASDAISPLTQPQQTVVNSISGSQKGVPEPMKKVLRTLQNQAWKLNEVFDDFVKLANDFPNILEELVELEEVNPQYDTDYHIMSTEARNNSKLKDIQAAVDLSKEGTLNTNTNYYFRYSLMNQHRIRQEGAVSPQNSKIFRHLMQPEDAITYVKSNKNQIIGFKVAVLSNMIDKVDKMRPQDLLKTFDEMIKEDLVQNAIAAFNNRHKNYDKFAEALHMLAKDDRYLNGISLLQGVAALSAYQSKSKTFTSSITLEIDGVTNGWSLNLIQFPMFTDETTLRENFERVGVFFHNNAIPHVDETSKLDTYEVLRQEMAQADTPENAWKIASELSKLKQKETGTPKNLNENKFKKDYIRTRAAVHVLYPDTADETKRSLVKTAFMVFMYGGSLYRAADGIAKAGITELHATIGQINKKLDLLEGSERIDFIKTTYIPFMQAVNTLGGFPSDLNKNKAFNILVKNAAAKIDISALPDLKKIKFNIIQDKYMTIISPSLSTAIDITQGDLKFAKTGVATAIEFANGIYISILTHKFNKIEKENNVRLSNSQRKEIAKKELGHISPAFAGPMSGTDPANYVDLTNFDDKDQSMDDLSRVTIKTAIDTRDMSSFRKMFSYPGASGLIRSIINMDAAILAKVIETHSNVLPLYDALMGDPATLKSAAETYNKYYSEWGLSYSVMTNAMNVLRNMEEYVENISDEEIRKEINTDIIKRFFQQNPDSESSYSTIRSELNMLEKSIDRKRTALKEALNTEKSVYQMHYPDPLIASHLNDGKSVFPTNEKQDMDIPVSAVSNDTQETNIDINQKNSKGISSTTAKQWSVPVQVLNESTEEAGESLNREIEELLNIKTSAEDKSVITNEFVKTVDNILMSLDTNDTQVDVSNTQKTDITAENSKQILEDMNKISNSYYDSVGSQEKHTDILKTVLEKAARGIEALGNIPMTYYNVLNMETYGSFNKYKQSIDIFVQSAAPTALNSQSPQEVYTHELVHAVTVKGLDTYPLLKHKIDKLYAQVKREVIKAGGYKVFLNNQLETPETRKKAKEMYQYIFERVESKQGTAAIEAEKNRAAEFIAYALTNQGLATFLFNMQTSAPIRDTSLTGKLLNIIDTVFEIFARKVNKGVQANTYLDILALTEKVISIQSKHISKRQSALYNAKIQLDIANVKLRTGIAKITEYILTKVPKGKFTVTKALHAAGVIGVTSVTGQDISKLRISLNVKNKIIQIIADVMDEISSGSLSKAMIDQIAKLKNFIHTTIQNEMNQIIEVYRRSWKASDSTKFDLATERALTMVMLRTDLQCLLKLGMSHKEIMGLVKDTNKVLSLKKRLLNEMNLKTSDRVIHYANELGRYMVTDRTSMYNSHENVDSIIATELPERSKDDILTIKTKLDAYTSLIALESIRVSDRKKVSKLSDKEFNEDDTDNAFITLLDYQQLYVNTVINDLFKGNPMQSRKGYTIEKIDELHDIKIGSAKDAATMAQLGYTEAVPLTKIAALSNEDISSDTMFVARNLPEKRWVSGALSTASGKARGTTLTEIMANSGKFINLKTGLVDYGLIKQAIVRITKEQTDLANTGELDHTLKLRPIRNDKGGITDYRIVMDLATKEQLLNPDMSIHNVWAHMHSSAINKSLTVRYNKQTVGLLAIEQKDMPKDHKGWVNILDPASKYHEQFLRLPKDTRRYIKNAATRGKFYMNEKSINKILGYQAWDLSDVSILNKQGTEVFRYVARIAHYIVHNVVGYAMDRIILTEPAVAISNIMSNIFQLMNRGVPLKYALHKITEGYREYRLYQSNSNKLAELRRRIKAKNLSSSSAESKEALRLKAAIEASRMHKYTYAGLNSLIVEDLSEASANGYTGRIEKSLRTGGKFENVGTAIPTTVKKLAKSAFLTRNSKIYSIFKHIVAMTDFLARYALIEYTVQERGVNFESAKHEALEAFVFFDEVLNPALEAGNSVGVTIFISYYLRTQRAIKSLLKNNPLYSGIALGAQKAIGIEFANIINSHMLFGHGPSVAAWDNIIEQVVEPAGIELVGDVF